MQSRFFIFIIISCSLVLFACTSRSKSAEDDSQKFLTNHELFELCNVYDSLAMFSPKIGCDTEADWAAEEAHKIALNAQKAQYGYNEIYSSIYKIQYLTAYGLCYVPAIYASASLPQYSKAGLSIVQFGDSLYNDLKESNFQDTHKFLELSCISLHYMQLYMEMRNQLEIVNGRDEIFQQNAFGSSYNRLELIDSLYQAQIPESDIFKISNILESAEVFNTYIPLIHGFVEMSPQQQKANSEIIMNDAHYLDSMAAPIFMALSNKTNIPVPTDEEFYDYMRRANHIKIYMLRLLYNGIKSHKG